MSSFRKVNVSEAELNKNPYKNAAKTSESINNSEVDKNHSSSGPTYEPLKTQRNQDKDTSTDPETSFNNNSQDGEVPPGNPVNNESQENSTDTEHMQVEDNQNSKDVTGIDLSEWYFPEGDLPWINY